MGLQDTTAPTLLGFAYGEELGGMPERSLGYRLLAPAVPESWRAEVETLARRLQAAPYSDNWPPTDLFCSVLLAGSDRVVAVARYGLTDHTRSHRLGGLELIGVLAPGSLGVPSALAVYKWLRRRRAKSDNLHSLGGRHLLADILTVEPALPLPTEPAPVPPSRLQQEDALLYAAMAPSDPDRHLGLLQQCDSTAWQWLPLIGPEFPLETYAQRGPLIAWTPQPHPPPRGASAST